MSRPARVSRLTALALIAGLPAVTALAFAQGSPDPSAPPADGVPSIVAEQVSTARDIVPFGASRSGTTPDSGAVVWATGTTRDPSVQAPGPDPPTTPATSPTISTGPSDAQPSTDEPAVKDAADATTPQPTLLLDGMIADPGDSTTWQRADPPLDAEGKALDGLAWRPAGGTAAFHAGAATDHGAAAMLVQLGAVDDPARRSGIIARQRGDGRFQVLPTPPTALLAPATQLYDTAPTGARLPFAVVDGSAAAPVAGTTPTTTPTATATPTPTATVVPTAPVAPPSTPPGATKPALPSVDTGLLLAPPGGDGVLAWDGTGWHEEPYLDQAGDPLTTPRTPIALSSTADGDGVALLENSDPTSPTRFRLYHRTADHAAWREVSLRGAPLLDGPLPDHVTAVQATPSPGDPLTVASGQWWIDVLATRDDGRKVSATIHLTPASGPALTPTPTPNPTDTPTTTPEPGATPDPNATPVPTVTAAPTTTPDATATATPAAAPTPNATTSPTTSPSPTAVATPTDAPSTTPPSTTPTTVPTATQDGIWCQPTLATCTDDLDAEFATSRGYRSFAFPGKGFGGRIITSPVLSTTGAEPAREASASGGYLALSGSEWQVRSGVGDPGDGAGLTQASAFATDTLGWVGAPRAVGHVRTAPDGVEELADGSLDGSDAMIAVAASPGGTPPELAGAIAVTSSQSLRRTMHGAAWQWANSGLESSGRSSNGQPIAAARAIAWPQPNTVVVVGTEGLLVSGPPPLPDALTNVGSSTQALTQMPGTNGLDFLSVGFSQDGTDGWAVGRDGASMHFSNGQWARVVLAPAILKADLVQVAYAGQQPLVASSIGLLRPAGGRFDVDPDLAALLAQDHRGPGVRSVAALPSGAAVVDARYIRDSAAAAWRRLPFPAEGDVITTALVDGGVDPTTRAPLQPTVLASIADDVPDRRGPQPDPDPEAGQRGQDDSRTNSYELAPLVSDGRLEQLGADGWVDREVNPIATSTGRDLAYMSRNVNAIAARPDGAAYVVGGTGTYANYLTSYSAPHGYAVSLVVRPRGAVASTPVTPAVGTARQSRTARASAARDETSADPTSVPITPTDEVLAPAPTRILVGGHPACLDECAGRGDQRVGPSATLVQALHTAARIRDSDHPVSALVIGGGRASAGGAPLSAAGADNYATLLRSVPDTPPVLPAIGTGDAFTDEGRTNFASKVAPLFEPSATSTGVSGSPPAPSRASDPGIVAYSADVGRPAGSTPKIPVRLVVIDNASGGLRGGPDGAQATWIGKTLADARDKGMASIVIGGPRLDDKTTLPPDEAQRERSLFAAGSATAYVGTDGSDDPNDLTQFGPRASALTEQVDGHPLQLIHSAALGHFIPYAAQYRVTSAGLDDVEQDRARQDALDDWTNEPELVALDVVTQADGSYGVDVSTVPVFRSFGTPSPFTVPRGAAQLIFATTLIDADNGMRWTDPSPEAAGQAPRDTSGFGFGDATPDQCRLFEPAQFCGVSLPTDATFTVDDPSVAVFVRAKAPKSTASGSSKDRGGSPPQILIDAEGNPIIDAHSPVLCPLAPGVTSATITTGGQSVRVPLTVTDAGLRPITDTGSTDTKAPCSFFYGRSSDRTDAAPAKPAPAAPAPVVPKPAAPVKPVKPSHHTTLPTAHDPVPRPLLAAPPVDIFRVMPPAAAKPPVAPNPKPIAGPLPAPPSGISPQQVPQQVPSPNVQMQSMVAAVQQESRRKQAARESADHRAVIYQHASRSDVPALVGGALLTFLLAALGAIAGRRRAPHRSPARAWNR